MVIDLTELITFRVNELLIDDNVVISDDFFKNTSIKGLNNTHFKGNIVRISDSDYQLSGNISGEMILPDDITLEDVIYPYSVDIEDVFNDTENENKLQIIQNKLDITEFLWQNILVEVPSKIKNDKNEGLIMEGNGWRLITEEELKKGNNSPFSELSEIFDSRKE